MDVPVNYFLELINISFSAVVLMFLRKRFDLDDTSFLLLVLHLLLVFFTNYVLFSPMYMGDQFTYLSDTQFLRGMDAILKNDTPRVLFASTLFAFFPMPLINSVYSIALINFLLYVILFIFFREKGLLKGSNRTFYFIYPSLALYSSLALRDTLIFFLMALFLYYVVIRKKLFLPLLLLGLPILLLKYQNFFVLIIATAFFIVFHKRYHPLLKILIIVAGIAGIYFFSSQFTIQNFNRIRWLFFLENNLTFAEFNGFSNWGDALLFSFASFFSFLLQPLPWETKNTFQIVQSLENIFIAILLLSLFFKQRFKFYRIEKLSLLIFFFTGILIYATVIINAGTAARYRYPFIALFVIFFNYFKFLPEKDNSKAGISNKVNARAIKIVAIEPPPDTTGSN